MIENQYRIKKQDGKSVFVTTSVVVVRTTTSVPQTVFGDGVPLREWAKGKCVLIPDGASSVLTVQPDYEWDGVSFPFIDLNRTDRMEATLHHDAIYEALRELAVFTHNDERPVHPGTPPWSHLIGVRKWADRCFREILRRDRAPNADLHYEMVREFSGGAAWPQNWPPRVNLLKKLYGIP